MVTDPQRVVAHGFELAGRVAALGPRTFDLWDGDPDVDAAHGSPSGWAGSDPAGMAWKLASRRWRCTE